MSTTEQSKQDNAKKYTELDMLAAFQHGREYESLNIEGDIAPEKLLEKNRSFWEWLKITRFQYTTYGGLSKI